MIVDPLSLPPSTRHGLLLSAVSPRPICFASTIDAKGHVNLSPFSFFNLFSTNPPVMVFSPSRRGRDSTTKDTLNNVDQIKEVSINMVSHALVEQMSLSSTEYDPGVDEFIKSGLTAERSEKIRPPRVGEAPVSFECQVNDIIPLGKEGGAGNLVICEVLLMHIRDEFARGRSITCSCAQQFGAYRK